MKKSLLLLSLIFGLSQPLALALPEACRETLNRHPFNEAPDAQVVAAVVNSAPYQNVIRENWRDKVSNQWKLLVTRLTKPTSKDHPKLSAKVFILLTVLAPASVLAQQSLFNTPSVEATNPGHFFFQQQFNFLIHDGVSNTTLDYGLGNGWSAGLSLYNIRPYSPEGPRPIPDTLFNLEKIFSITPHWDMAIGTQSGFNPGRLNSNQSFVDFTFIQNKFTAPNDWGKYYLGYYYANKSLFGDGNRNGFMVGYDIPLIKDKLNLMGDYVSGTNEGSVAVIGVVVLAPQDWQISLGAQLPSPGSHNDYGFVLEITKMSF